MQVSTVHKSDPSKICSTDEQQNPKKDEVYPAPPPIKKLELPKLQINIRHNDTKSLNLTAPKIELTEEKLGGEPSDYMSQTTKSTAIVKSICH